MEVVWRLYVKISSRSDVDMYIQQDMWCSAKHEFRTVLLLLFIDLVGLIIKPMLRLFSRQHAQ